MKHLPLILLLCILLNPMVLLRANEVAEPTVEELHSGLRALKATMESALNKNDVDTLLQNVTEDVVFTTMNGDNVRGAEGIRKYFDEMLGGKNPRVVRVQSRFEADDLSHFYGKDVAVAFGTSRDHYELAGGKLFDVDARWSGTMVRKDGRWLIANFHYSTNMFDNPVLDAQRKYLLIGAGVLAVVMLILGFWVGRMRKNKLSQ